MSMIPPLNLTGGRRLPAILQIEAAECGLACLAMVAQYHGNGENLADLRRRFNISLKGATLYDLIEIGEKLGLAGRPLQLELNEIDQLQLPCILHWDMNHFVVLAKVERGSVTVNDPAVGIRKLSTEEFSRHFTGVALELNPTSAFEKKAGRPSPGLLGVLGRIRGLKRALTKLLVIALAIEILAVLSPLFLGWVVDHVLVSSDRDLLLTLAIGFFLLLLMRTALGALRSWMLMTVKASAGIQARANLFNHMLSLPASFFETRHIGDVMTRFNSQEQILNAITGEFVEALLDGVMAIITLALMMILAPMLAVVTLAGAVLYALVRWASYAPLRNATSEGIIWRAKKETHFLETIRGIRTIKLFNGNIDRRVRWLNLAVETINREITAERIRIYTRTTSQFIVGVLAILIVWLGARQILDGGFSVGLLFAFVAYKDQFLQHVNQLIDKVIEISVLRLHADRLSDIVLTEPEKRGQEPDARGPKEPEIGIELRGIGFRYSEHEPWILKDVTLSIAPGESVVFTGPSGCGKTTLLKIMAGLLTPTEGEIYVNGQPLSRYGLTRYRLQMGVVMQDDQLFAGSIAENISFFAADIDQDRVMRCARLASVQEDIEAMPMGYASLIGDMGTILSGGQKQRILIARALYRSPKVLLMDEATSHLDVSNERAVNNALRRARVTRIIVAHRPETIRAAGREIRLLGGTVAAPQKQAS